MSTDATDSTAERATRRGGIFLAARHTSVFNRISAKSVDFIIASAIFVLGEAVLSPLGFFLSSIYAAFGDGMGNGQSIGKRIFGLRVVESATNVSCSYQESLIRNLPFSLMFLLSIIPLFWGMLMLIAIAVLGFEVYLLFNLESGIRLGDVLANTVVTEDADEMPSSEAF